MTLSSEFNIGPLIIRANVIDDDIVTGVFVGTKPTDMHAITGFRDPFSTAAFVQELQAWSEVPDMCDAKIDNHELEITVKVKRL